MSAQQEVTKTLKFLINTTPEQLPILEKLTARHTFAIRKYLALLQELSEEQEFISEGELDQLTIITESRASVPFDFKAETGLSTSNLQQAGRTALAMWRSYQTNLSEWKRRSEAAGHSTILSMLSDVEFTSEGQVVTISTTVEEVIKKFSETRMWRRLRKGEPSPPLQREGYQPRKIPMILMKDINFPPFLQKISKGKYRSYHQFVDGQLFVKVSTLKPRQPLLLNLQYGEYHLQELQNGRLTGGKIVKNLKKNRWEFHSFLRKEVPIKKEPNRKQAVLGVDLGIATDATVVVLIEDEPLRKDRFHFLKEGDLRKKKDNYVKTTKKLQRVRDTTEGKAHKQTLKELQIIGGKKEQLTDEACHRIARKVAEIAHKYIEADYEVHVAVGQLKGLRNIARKGNGKGKKYRGKISRFPFHKLTKYITYKCLEVGVTDVQAIKESWTSKMCHKCDSTNTERPTQAQFICLGCGLQYNADANGAINIALRYWTKRACRSCRSLKTTFKKGGLICCSACKGVFAIKENTKQNAGLVKLIFLPSSKQQPKRKSVERSQWLSSPGMGDAPPCEKPITTNRQESTGNEGLMSTIITPDHLKVEEARKRTPLLKG